MSDWELEPLEGKYYQTALRDSNAGYITISAGVAPFKASDREIANGWIPGMGCDHVERQADYELALRVLAALNDIDVERHDG